MTPRPTPRLRLHAALAVAGLLAAVVTRSPALVILVTPSLALLAMDLPWRPTGGVRIALRLDPPTLVEGGTTTLHLRVTSPVATTAVIAVPLPRMVAPRDAARWHVRLRPDQPVDLAATVTAGRWGGSTVGPVSIRRRSPGGLFEAVSSVDDRLPLRVLPPAAAATVLLRPSETHASAGHRTSRARGEGSEFAALRPFAPGDRARDLNWRASARRGSPWVTQRHPDRGVDTVLLLDAFDEEHLDDVLRGALSLADGYLAARDRVGVTSLGGVMRWLTPGSGTAHQHRIVEALLDTRVLESYAVPAVASLPRRTLPPGALITVLTPATDPRMATIAGALRARGHDVAVIVLEPAPPAPRDELDALAGRLLALQRRAVRDRLHLQGLSAVGWDPADPVDVALAELRDWRRGARAVRT